MSAYYVPIRRLAYTLLGRIPQPQPAITVYCYHSLAADNWDFSINLTEFKKQILYLSQNYNFITLSDLHAYLSGLKQINEPSIIITFDDGYSDIYQAKDFLKSQHIRPTLFVLSDPIHANRKELGTDRPFLTPSQIRELAAAGWEIGCHTATHPDMHNLTSSQIDSEIVNSKSRLEKDLGVKINYIAFPKGRYNSKIQNAVSQAGYKLALTMDDALVTQNTNHLRVPRVGVDGTHSFAEFQVLGLPSSIFIRKSLKSV